LIYGTRIAWVCGRKCRFQEDPSDKKMLLFGNLPAATAVYFFGFIIVFTHFATGLITIFFFSITSAILLAHAVVSMAMPELKRQPRQRE
jgi:hypothetical protein